MSLPTPHAGLPAAQPQDSGDPAALLPPKGAQRLLAGPHPPATASVLALK